MAFRDIIYLLQLWLVMMPKCMKALLLIYLILFSTVHSVDPVSPIPCKSQCKKIFSSTKFFKSKLDMAKNLTQTIFKATTLNDLVNAFSLYDIEFKKDHINNLKAYNQMIQFRNALTNTYGAEAVNEYKLAKKGEESACSVCSEFKSDLQNAQTPFPGMFGDGQIVNNVDIEISIQKYRLVLPINKIPFLRRPDGIVTICFDNFENIFWQDQCFEQEMREQYESFHNFISPDKFFDYDPVRDYKPKLQYFTPKNFLLATDKTIYYEGLPDDSINGFANMNIYAKFGDALTNMYDKCVAGNFKSIC